MIITATSKPILKQYLNKTLTMEQYDAITSTKNERPKYLTFFHETKQDGWPWGTMYGALFFCFLLAFIIAIYMDYLDLTFSQRMLMVLLLVSVMLYSCL